MLFNLATCTYTCIALQTLSVCLKETFPGVDNYKWPSHEKFLDRIISKNFLFWTH